MSFPIAGTQALLVLTAIALAGQVRAQEADTRVVVQLIVEAEPMVGGLLDQADAILQSIQLHRGILAEREVERHVMNRDAVLQRLLEIVERELPPGVRESQDRVAVALGLVEPGTSYFDMYLSLLEQEIAGFYDDATETFYILADTPRAMQAPVMAHELFHALQDQRWGIENVVGNGEWLTDVTLATQALIEGDALAVMAAFMLNGPDQVTGDTLARQAMMLSLGDAATMNTSGVPSAMWAQLVFPYSVGLAFVFELVQPGDWSPIDAVYDDPPQSTEQVMHPERYTNRDVPTWLDFQATVPGGERYLADVFGEFMIAESLRQVLADHVSDGSCDRAADGWDGDRLEAYQFADFPDRDVIVWASVWDDASEADGFATVASRLSAGWLQTDDRVEHVGEHGRGWFAESEVGSLWVERWGDMALVVLDWHGDASPSERSAVIRAAVDSTWATLERSRYPAF